MVAPQARLLLVVRLGRRHILPVPEHLGDAGGCVDPGPLRLLRVDRGGEVDRALLVDLLHGIREAVPALLLVPVLGRAVVLRLRVGKGEGLPGIVHGQALHRLLGERLGLSVRSLRGEAKSPLANHPREELRLEFLRKRHLLQAHGVQDRTSHQGLAEVIGVDAVRAHHCLPVVAGFVLQGVVLGDGETVFLGDLADRLRVESHEFLRRFPLVLSLDVDDAGREEDHPRALGLDLVGDLPERLLIDLGRIAVERVVGSGGKRHERRLERENGLVHARGHEGRSVADHT